MAKMRSKDRVGVASKADGGVFSSCLWAPLWPLPCPRPEIHCPHPHPQHGQLWAQGLGKEAPAPLTLLVEEAVERLHDSRAHDLPEEGVLLSQLLGCEVLPAARGPLVVVEEVDEGCVGRLGEELLIDVGEEPGRGGGKRSQRPGCWTRSRTHPGTSTYRGRRGRVASEAGVRGLRQRLWGDLRYSWGQRMRLVFSFLSFAF